MPPTMVMALMATLLAELEAETPGLVDRLIMRLSSDALRAQVVRLRGAKTTPAILEAQSDALAWLTALAPFMRAREAKKGKRR